MSHSTPDDETKTVTGAFMQDLASGASYSDEFMPPNMSGTLEPGTIIDDKFEIQGFLGEGGMSTVYKAKHLQIDRPVAVKILHEKLLSDKDAVKRFQREAVAISSLDHANIVGIYGFGVIGRGLYMAMEYLEGISLAELLRQEKRLTKEQALPIFTQILDALEHAHEKGIIHRDIKPSNVMLIDPGHTVKLVDFGIAKMMPAFGKDIQKLTQTGAIFGSLIYMSPEQCATTSLDARSDVYSMGVLMYEVLDGSPPFLGDTPYLTMAKHVTDQPRVSEYVAADLGIPILAALEKDPEKRPQSAAALQDALHNTASFAKARNLQKQPQQRKSAYRIITKAICVFVAIAAVSAGGLWVLPQLKLALGENKTPRDTEGSNPDDPHHLQFLTLQAQSFAEKGQYAKAEKMYIEAVNFSQSRGLSQSDEADISSDLADIFRLEEKYPAAERLYRGTLAFRYQAINPNRPATVKLLYGLANTYQHEGKNAEAAENYDLWLEKVSRVIPFNVDHQALERLNQVREFYKQPGNIQNAESLEDMRALEQQIAKSP